MFCFSSTSFGRYLGLVCLLTGTLLALAGCGLGAVAGAPPVKMGGTSSQQCDIQVSWAMAYSSLHELKHAPALDLAVQGTFTKTLSTQGQFAPSNAQDAPLTSDFSFAVSKVLLDPRQAAGNVPTSLTLHQTGGILGGTLHQVCDDPLFQAGEEAILFLHEFQPGHYLVMGGPSGRFEVRNGQVQPVNDEGVKLPAHLTPAQFYTLFQQA